MKHNTKDVGQRATDIANHEAGEYYRKTRDPRGYFDIWFETYDNALKELAGQE